MVTLVPNWDEINNLPTPLTDGERHFIRRIESIYENDSTRNLEVFVQANINMDRPDIVVVEHGGGIWIVEVKDWNLDLYDIEDQRWNVRTANGVVNIKSPFRQATRYKENIFTLHNHYLATRKISNPGVYGLVKCGVYFHCADEDMALDYKSLEYEGKRDGKFIHAFGKDTTDQTIKTFFNAPNTTIEHHEYNHLMRFIRPSEEARPIRKIDYSQKQLSLIKSEPKYQKVKGAAGSGKSLVLAARAVNALKRTNGKVLIITFNITLINYIHDRISEVRGTYRRKDFDIISYHAFINAECNNLGIETHDFVDFDNPSSQYNDIHLFDKVKDQIVKYDSIFIDEVQDFRYEWQQILANYFLVENGELVLFGDEKQNIYSRELKENKIHTIIPGAWNTLLESHRLSEKSIELAMSFQKYFFKDRYELDNLQYQLKLDLENDIQEKLIYISTLNLIDEIDTVQEFIIEQQIHPNDIVFLGSTKDTLRDIDYKLRQMGEHTTRTFTSLEEYNNLLENSPSTISKRDSQIERALKVGFWMNTGCMKVSTIQSFKGWEANTVILVIEENTESLTTINELIYTGLTRCKKNLIILNQNKVV